MNSLLNLPPLTRENLGNLISKTTIAAVVVFAFWVIITNYQIVLIVFLAIFLSTALQPLFRRLSSLGISKPMAIYAIYGSLALSFILFFWYGLPQLLSQNQVLLDSSAGVYQNIRSEFVGSGNPLLNQLGRTLPSELLNLSDLPTIDISAEEGGDGTQAADEATISPTMWLVLSSGVKAVVYTVVVLALSFYWSLEGQRLIQLLMLTVPFERRDKVRTIISEIEEKVGAFVIGQIILCAFIFGLSLILYLVIGLPYAFILALVAGLFEVIPNIGPLLGAIPALVVALTANPVMAVWVLLGTAVMQGIENYLLVPRVMEKTVGVRPFITILAIVIFGALFGVIGAVVAIPLAVIIEIILTHSIMENTLEGNDQADRGKASVLRYEAQQIVQDLRKQIRHKKTTPSAASDQIEDSLESIVVDLDSLLSTYNAEQNGGKTVV